MEAGRASTEPLGGGGAESGRNRTGEAEIPSERSPRGRRSLWVVVLLLVVAAALLWGASSMTWQWSVHVADFRGRVVSAINGGDVEPALVPLALLYLAAVAAAVATGGWLRRAIGVLAVVAGLGGVWLGVHSMPAVFDAHPTGYPVAQVVTGHALAILAGLTAIAGGVVLVRRARGMPRMGTRYQTPAAVRVAAKRVHDEDKLLWEELSQGRDPTEASGNSASPRATGE